MANAITSIRRHALPAIATLVAGAVRAEHSGTASLSAWTDGPQFLDVQQLIASDFTPGAVLLTPSDADQAATWLASLRRDPRLGLVPILLNRSFGEDVDGLSDGVASTSDAVARHAEAIAARARSLNVRDSAEGDERLLSFLYLRNGKIVTPSADWRDERIYRYPLADAFSPSGEDGFLMLDRMRRRGLLESAGLIERVHTCAACSAGQLLFIETCPQCGSIDTTEHNFLHCYACGNVATQEEYLTHEGLGCPKCSARLRHIGVDYDRALESFVCEDCKGRFTEACVKARCLQCKKLSSTDELAERSYYALRLSAAGEMAARTGQIGDLFKLMDEFSHAHPEYFARTLDWLLGLARRHTEVQFGLICIKFANIPLLTTRLPRHRVVQMFDALGQRLRSLIRTTDLFMRDDDEYCWLLLPQTSPGGVGTLLERIAALSTAATPDEALPIEIVTAAFSSVDRDEGANDARMLMGTLRNRVG